MNTQQEPTLKSNQIKSNISLRLSSKPYKICVYCYYKDNAVGNVVAETGRVGGTTTRLSGLSMPFPLCASPLQSEVRRSPEPSARPYGEEGRFDVAARSDTPNSNSCDHVVAQVKDHKPEQPG